MTDDLRLRDIPGRDGERVWPEPYEAISKDALIEFARLTDYTIKIRDCGSL